MDFLLNLPEETLYTAMGILGGAICALHLLTSFELNIVTKIEQFVNIILHIALFVLLMLGKAPINVAVTVFMASLFLYVGIRFVKSILEKKGGGSDDV